MQALWQSQPGGEHAVSLDQIREKARHLERRVARRNLREYVAAIVVVPAFGWVVWVGPSSTIRVGAGLLIAAAVFVVYRLHLRGTARPLPSDLALRSALDFHRVQLERQRDLLRSVWWWGLLPFAPGFLVMDIGMILALPEHTLRIAVSGALAIPLMLVIYELNRRASARIQQRLSTFPNPEP